MYGAKVCVRTERQEHQRKGPKRRLRTVVRMSTTRWWALLQHIEKLQSLLYSTPDLSKLSQDLLNRKVLSQDFSTKFSSLDADSGHLEPEVKVRYLLHHVLERVREDGKVFNKLVRVLSRLGGKVKDECDAMSRDVARESTSSRGEENEIKLVIKDVPHLVKRLVLCSHLWENIGIALEIPQHKIVDCSAGTTCTSKLSNILTTYVQGEYEGARPATLSKLKEALAGDIVRKKVLALKLDTPTRESDNSLPNASSLDLEILDQSYDTEVAEGKSTLLEVQVSSSGCESYQWSKDGEPLLDGADFSGVCNSILFINKASKCTEGKYSCRLRRGDEAECSDEISLSIIYPPGKKELLKLYLNRERKLAVDSWPPTSKSEFINLALIRKQKKKGTSTYDYYTVRGDMDDILESKEEAEYKEVFREYREGGLLLIEGRPGCGKTTLVHKLSKDWAEGKKVLQGAKMVFLVTLRLINESGKDKTLLDLLQIFYGNVLNKDIEHDLQKYRGKGACFILDGLDEYPIEKMKNSVIGELLNTRTLLPDSMVIVASRPVATNELKQRCKTRIEVIGFHKDQIYSYVRSYPFHNSGMVVKMEEYLHQHPNVLHMCYLPVHAAMICFLFSKLEGNIPQTETQIYEQFTIATLLRHKVNKSEGVIQMKSLMELSGEEKALFNSICKLAYDMIINSQQVIKKSVAQISVSTNLDFGLLTVERTSEYYGSEDLYTFHHLTFQEFLAAFYIREAQVEDEVLIVKNSLRNVWKFYCGLTQLFNNIKFATLIIETLNIIYYSFVVQCAFESQHVELCDLAVDDENIDVGGDVISSIAQGFVLSKCTKPVTTISICSTWDSEGVELFTSMASRDKLQSIKCLRIHFPVIDDEFFVAMNSFLSHHLPFLEELDFTSTDLTKSRIELLTGGVTLANLKVLTLPLKFDSPFSRPEKVFQLLKFGSNNLKQIFYQNSYYNISNSDCGVWRKILSYAFGCQVTQDYDMSWLHLYSSETAPSLPHERLSHCTEVVLVNCCIGDEGAEILANTSFLEKLVLDFNRISDSGAVALAGCLARCSAIQEVSIQCNCIGDSGATALANALVHCNSLRRLDLQGNSLGDKGAVAIAKATEKLPSLDLYLHNVNITKEGIEKVLEHRARTYIRSMLFTTSWNSVSGVDMDTLRRALYCGNLPALQLSKSNISNIGELVTEQEHVKNVIGIVCQEIADDAVPTLCSILKCFPNLHYIMLSLRFNSCSRVQLISDSLKTYKSLHTLALDYRDLPHGPLLEAVQCFTKLHTLYLPYCSLNSYEVALLCSNTELWVNLHNLKLSGSSNSDWTSVLSKMLVHCKSLRSLNLGCYEKYEVKEVAEALKDHTDLIELRLHKIIAISEDLSVWNHVISCNQHLQHLQLEGFILGPEGVATLVDVMCGYSLQTLNLGNNQLGYYGIACLSFRLKKFTQLVQLDISHNNISSHGVACLSRGLQYCTKLQELNLSNNEITSDGISAVLNIMKNCTCLNILNLDLNNIGVDGAAALVEGWQYKRLLVLSLYDCIGYSHQSALIEGIKHCSSCDRLQQLYYNSDYVDIGYILPKRLSL